MGSRPLLFEYTSSAMTTTTPRDKAWKYVLLNLGGLIFYVLMAATERSLRIRPWVFWPLVNVLLALYFSFRIWQLRHAEPSQEIGSKKPQVGLSGLIGISFLFGVLLALWQAVGEKIFIPERQQDRFTPGIVASAGVCVFALAGLLAASRHELFSFKSRFCYAAAHGLKIFGMLGWGGFFSSWLAMLFCNPNNFFYFPFHLFLTPPSTSRPTERVVIWGLRLALIALPVGKWLTRAVLRSNSAHSSEETVLLGPNGK